MRWIVLSDIHGDLDALTRALDEAGSYDLAIIAGDITNFGDAVEARAILAPLFDRLRPIVAVSGNCDGDGVRTALESAGVSIEGRCAELAGFTFAGAGGGLRRHGMTPYESTEDELEALLLSALDGEDRGRKGGRSLVVVTHTPPNGTPLDRRGSSHFGSHAFRTILGERVPSLWVSGHIHEGRSLWTTGASVLVNPGSVHEGYFAVADILEGEPPRVTLESFERRPSRGGSD